MKLLLALLIIGLVGCGNKKTGNPLPIVIHDTVRIETPNIRLAQMEGTIKILLVQYYKAGWMDASNGLINLSNQDNFDSKNIEKIKHTDWRKIEADVNRRSAMPSE